MKLVNQDFYAGNQSWGVIGEILNKTTAGEGSLKVTFNIKGGKFSEILHLGEDRSGKGVVINSDGIPFRGIDPRQFESWLE